MKGARFARTALAAVALLSCAAVPSCARSAPSASGPRPGVPPKHLVIVTVAGLRADHLSCYGYRRATSFLPADHAQRTLGRAMGVDDLARAGVLFANAYAPSGSTVASLATLFSGRAPLETGVEDDHFTIPSDVASLPEILGRAGFHTSAFVTARSVDLQRALGRGFLEFHQENSDPETIAAASRWLDHDFGNGQPVFVWLHLGGLEPSWARRPAEPQVGAFSDSRRFADPHYQGPIDGSRAAFDTVHAGEIQLADADRAQTIDLYDGEIASTLGLLTVWLQRAFDYYGRGAEVSEFWSRTVFVLTSPHGIELFERGRVGHTGGLHDEVLHVPLLFRHPDSLSGERVSSEIVELADVLPTVLDWFAIEAPRDVDGRALLAHLDRHVERPFESRLAIAAAPERVFTARSARWRLVWENARARPGTGDVRLYDQRSDRRALIDVAARHPEVVRQLQLSIARWALDRQAHARSEHVALAR